MGARQPKEIAMYIDPRRYQIAAIAKALRFYSVTGMKVNRLYTPKNMIAKAEELTGQKFKKRDYVRAAMALEEMLK